MRTLFVAVFLLFATPLSSQPVGVASGAHDGFSRLVFTFPKPFTWSLVRTEGGYALSVTGVNDGYDLSAIYRRIETNRLASISFDKGVLQLQIACACYAMPFEFRDGILVLDIKDGSAPEGSSFELLADGTQAPPLRAKETLPASNQDPKPEVTAQSMVQPIDVDAAIAVASRVQTNTVPILAPSRSPDLDEAREDLLWQLSKGVVEGVVDVVESLDALPAGTPASGRPEDVENIRIGIGLDAKASRRPADHMTGVGDACFTDEQLDISSWGDLENVARNYAENTTSLVGEFDRPDEAAIAQSIRFNLAMGFGAEARQILNALKVSLPERKLWETLSYIVDLEVPPGSVFLGMEVCDTPASLWAVLAKEDLPPTNMVAIPAILRSFSSLPLHLRRHLGPGLANRFLKRNDPGTARAIQDAILRAPGDAPAAVKMLEAEIDLANGDLEAAEAVLGPLAGQTGPVGLQSTITLIRAQAETGQEVSVSTTTAAEALLAEALGGEEEGALRDAIALAYGSQNRFQEAFDVLIPGERDTLPLWQMLARRGGDDAIMMHAIFGSTVPLPRLPDVTARALARRLLDMGFPDPASLWLKGDNRAQEDLVATDALLLGEIAIARSDGLAALAFLEGLDSAEADILRANAARLLQMPEAPAQLSKIGQQAEAARAARAQNAWGELAELAQDGVWQEAASLIVIPVGSTEVPSSGDQSSLTEDLGPLALSRAALQESGNARSVLEKLIADQVIP